MCWSGVNWHDDYFAWTLSNIVVLSSLSNSILRIYFNKQIIPTTKQNTLIIQSCFFSYILWTKSRFLSSALLRISLIFPFMVNQNHHDTTTRPLLPPDLLASAIASSSFKGSASPSKFTRPSAAPCGCQRGVGGSYCGRKQLSWSSCFSLLFSGWFALGSFPMYTIIHHPLSDIDDPSAHGLRHNLLKW